MSVIEQAKSVRPKLNNFINCGEGDGKKLTRVPFKVSRLMEFCTRRELTNQTGHDDWHWPLVIVKECVDNAIDDCEEHGIAPQMEVAVTPTSISIVDNGSGIPAETVDGVLDYGVRISSREAYCSPTRGAQGNALKTLLPMGYVLAAEEGAGEDAAGRTVIESHGTAHHIAFNVNHVRQEPRIARIKRPSKVARGTRITTELPKRIHGTLWAEHHKDNILKVVDDFLWLNPHLSLRLLWNGKTLIDEVATDPQWTKWTPSRPTSAHWYDLGSLQRYMAAHIVHRDDVTVREFVAEFYGLSGSAKQKAVLREIGASHVKLADYFGRTRTNTANVGRLLDALKRHSREVRPEALGLIGEAHLRRKVEEAGGVMESFTYRRSAEVTNGVPHVSEFAFAPHRDAINNVSRPRKLVTGVNWSAAIGANPFRQIGSGGHSLDGLLSDLSADKWEPVILVLHYATPRLFYTDRGKTTITVPGKAGYEHGEG